MFDSYYYASNETRGDTNIVKNVVVHSQEKKSKISLALSILFLQLMVSLRSKAYNCIYKSKTGYDAFGRRYSLATYLDQGECVVSVFTQNSSRKIWFSRF